MLEAFWYIVCRSKQLGRQPLRRRLFDRRLVLFRDRDGRAACLEDRCLHRNMPLSAGQVVEGTLQCPYHGWRYDGAGRVCAIPAMPACAHRAHAIQAKHYPVKEQDGYIWVSLAEQPAQPEPPRFPHLNERGWASFRMSRVADGGVEAWLENFLDCPHTSYVHKGLFRNPSTRVMRVRVRELTDGAEAEFLEADEERRTSLIWKLLVPKKVPVQHIDRFIAPAMSRVEYHADNHDYFISSLCTPISASRTAINTVITFRHGLLTPFVRIVLPPLAQLILQQDVAVLRRQHENIEHFGGERFRVIPQDLLLPHIRRWRRALAEGRTPTPRTEQNRAERERDIVI